MKGALVLDASVLINLLALDPKHLERISRAVGAPLLVSPQVLGETPREPRTRASSAPRISHLFASGVLAPTELSPSELRFFLGLVSADPPDDLSDGEAATLAIAAGRSVRAAIDETKGLRIARATSIECTSTLSLLLAPGVRRELGTDLTDALEAALTFSRMSVSVGELPALLEVLGVERASEHGQLGRGLAHLRGTGQLPP